MSDSGSMYAVAAYGVGMAITLGYASFLVFRSLRAWLCEMEWL